MRMLFRFAWRVWFFMGFGGAVCGLIFVFTSIPFTKPLIAYFVSSGLGLLHGSYQMSVRRENPLAFLPPI